MCSRNGKWGNRTMHIKRSIYAGHDDVIGKGKVGRLWADPRNHLLCNLDVLVPRRGEIISRKFSVLSNYPN